jgi:hypothetical protein
MVLRLQFEEAKQLWQAAQNVQQVLENTAHHHQAAGCA